MTDSKPEEAVQARGVDRSPPPDSHPAVKALVVLIVVGVAAVILVPQIIRTSHHLELPSCKSNIKNLATALEMYAGDNKGRYPLDMHQLIKGNYLKLMPTCPGRHTDTYSQSYHCTQTPNEFTFYCAGLNHGWEYPNGTDSTNYPQFTSRQGVLDPAP